MHLRGFGRALLMAEKILDRRLRAFLKGVNKSFDSTCKAAKEEKDQSEQITDKTVLLLVYFIALYTALDTKEVKLGIKLLQKAYKTLS